MDEARDKHIQERLIEIATEIRDCELRLETSERLAQLLQLDAFRQLVATLNAFAAKEVEELTTKRCDEYTQGFRQGKLRALRVLGNTKPLSEDEVSHLRDTVIPDLRQKLEQGMNLLGGNQP